MQVEIKVTQADIEAGEPNSTRYCPVALAVRRALTLSPLEVYAGSNYLQIAVNSPTGFRAGAYWWPLTAESFVRRFDRGKPVEPFRFTISDEGGG